ncbi:hypothetical protein [Helicobacter sp. T3_23-1056]
MNQKFSVGEFILDCFICLSLMIISYIIFVIPSGLICSVLVEFVGIRSLNSEYGWVLLFALCKIFLYITWFYFLEKKNIIKYKIYKPSFWCVFVLLTAFWLYLAYGFTHRDGIK